MVVFIILNWLNVRAILIFMVLRGNAGSYWMMRLFCCSLGQNNYSAAFSGHCCNLRRWGSWGRCFHSGFFWAWAFLGFLGMLRGNSWAFAPCCFAPRTFLRYHSCWLFLDFGWSWSRRCFRLRSCFFSRWRRCFRSPCLLFDYFWCWLSFFLAFCWKTACNARRSLITLFLLPFRRLWLPR